MQAYRLMAYNPGCAEAAHSVSVDRAAHVMPAVKRLFDGYPECQTVSVDMEAGRLFSIDRQGRTTPT